MIFDAELQLTVKNGFGNAADVALLDGLEAAIVAVADWEEDVERGHEVGFAVVELDIDPVPYPVHLHESDQVAADLADLLASPVWQPH